MSAYSDLTREATGVYAVRMPIPQDIVALIEGDPSIGKALAVSLGARLAEWRDALINVKRGHPHHQEPPRSYQATWRER